MSAGRDPFLELPLAGVQLIEASAGTGKTYTLATLVTRLVVEQGLRPAQILAVTFTEAATQELRKRIRERLQLTMDLVGAPVAADASAEAVLTRQLLDAHRARSGESDEALRRRLRLAVLETDLAAIFTIHGFCARVLREHALEAGQGYGEIELASDLRALRAELAADLWRAQAGDEASADDLATLWPGGPEALAEDLRVLLGREPLLPAPGPFDPEAATTRLAAAETALRADIRACGDAGIVAVAAAIDADVLNRTSYKHDWLAQLHDWLRAFAEQPVRAGAPHPKLVKLTAAELEKGTKKDHKARVPDAPLGAAIDAYLAALDAFEADRAQRRLQLLHRLREDARLRWARLRRQRRVQGFDELIDGVADALDGANGEALARRLRAQYRVALVDEFQDTDARQWAIFRRVFGPTDTVDEADATPALFLIGDPKQAIYGFRGGDVYTYLEAARLANAAPALLHNFRSRPCVLEAVAALYANAGDAAFSDPRIRFQPIHAGGKHADADYQRNGTAAPALTLWQAPATGKFDSKGNPSRWRAGESRELATGACVAAIHAVLADARNGKASLLDKRSKALRAVRAGDIAVLVRSHHEATQVQRALAEAGIAAVAAGKHSLFATGEARELHALLLALLHGGDDGRLRTALSSVLLGVDAAGIAALAHDGAAHSRWQAQAAAWREHLLGRGPLALLHALCAEHAPRLLGLLDGERRLGNYLQLAEQLQEAQASTLGLRGLVDWLGQRIASADSGDEAQLLRLESDAARVQIVTLHKSKGLEYPLLFLPFVGIGGKERAPGRHCSVHDAQARRCLHWKFETLPGSGWKDASERWQAEQRAEDARLLYVGLTRASHALWIAHGDFFASDKTSLAPMLGDLARLQATPGVVFDGAPSPARLPRLPAESEAAVPPARRAAPLPASDWWVYSFSQLSRSDAGHGPQAADSRPPSSAASAPARSGRDETVDDDPAADSDAFDPRFAGNRFGVALHAALEHSDFAAWQGWREGAPAPGEQARHIARALRGEGYGEDLLADGVALATRLIGHTLGVTLPEGLRLCELPADERRAEIEFHFSLRPTRVDALLQLLHAHGVLPERERFGARARLQGLFNGHIDLGYRHAGKWYVLDYKTNRLDGYDAASLRRAMTHGEYDWQALLYTLALHRWLRFRLGAAYDYARDFGGIRYLFCRGLDAGRSDSPGIHAQCFAPELVHALDALFAEENPLSPARGGEGRAEGGA